MQLDSTKQVSGIPGAIQYMEQANLVVNIKRKPGFLA